MAIISRRNALTKNNRLAQLFQLLKHIVNGVRSMGLESQVGQNEHSVANGSPPLDVCSKLRCPGP